jgi:hypothetical protein
MQAITKVASQTTGGLADRSSERSVLLIIKGFIGFLPLIMSGFSCEEAILPNSPIPKIEHLRDSKSADASARSLEKPPHKRCRKYQTKPISC